jgi:hypothetical protein
MEPLPDYLYVRRLDLGERVIFFRRAVHSAVIKGRPSGCSACFQRQAANTPSRRAKPRASKPSCAVIAVAAQRSSLVRHAQKSKAQPT